MQELIDKIKNENCSESLQKLVDLEYKLCNYIFGYYRQKYPKCYALNGREFGTDRYSIVYEAAVKFDPKRNVKFNTYLGHLIKIYCLHRIKKCYPYLLFEKGDLELLIESQNKEHKEITQEHYQELKKIINQISSPRTKKIFELRYFSDDKDVMTWKEVGKQLNICQYWAIQLHDKELNNLRKKFKKSFCC
jgi:RNA polymerase sigma factor (sigma-70 family)